jgi:hypothetical protein
MKTLAEAAGLSLANVEYDSTCLQFWGSELISRDHAQIEVGLRQPNLGKFFTRKQVAEFRRNAEALNKKGLGDSAVFIMQKTQAGHLAQGSQPAVAVSFGQTLSSRSDD